MKTFFLNYYSKLLFLIAGTFFILAIIGGYQNYTPVPFLDLWYGYIGFYNQLINGNYAIWWSQHNEHRIVLSRIFLLLDLRFFHGKMIFLCALNYLLVISNIITYFYILKCAFPSTVNQNIRLILISLISILLLSLIQSFN